MLFFEVPLDTSRVETQRNVTGFYKGDNAGKALRLTLHRPNGEFYPIPESCTAMLYGKKPDGTCFLHNCTLLDGRAIYVPTAQTVAVIGTVSCQLVVYGANDVVLFAPIFTIEVEAPVRDTEEIESADELTALDDLLLRLQATLEHAEGSTINQDVQSIAADLLALDLAFSALDHDLLERFSETEDDQQLLYRGLPVGCMALYDSASSLPTDAAPGQFAYARNAPNAGLYACTGQSNGSAVWTHLDAKAHTHTNAGLLDLLTETDDNQLLYKGQAVGSLRLYDLASSLPIDAVQGELAYVQTGANILRGLYICTAMDENDRAVWTHLELPFTHSHSNSELLNRFRGTLDSLKYGEKVVCLQAPDTLVPLTPQTYDALIFRDDPLNVPVYIYDRISYQIAISNTDASELVQLTDTTDTVTGLPVPLLNVFSGENTYVCFMRACSGLWGTHEAGWYTVDETETPAVYTPCDPPVLTDFPLEKLTVCGDTYTDFDDLPPKAQSGLHSLSQMVNVDAESMGTIVIDADALMRFSGEIVTDRAATIETSEDIAFSLPTITSDCTDHQFALYMKTDTAIDMSFPNGTKFYGGDIPAIDAAGTYKLIGTADPFDHVWTIGMLSMEAVSE